MLRGFTCIYIHVNVRQMHDTQRMHGRTEDIRWRTRALSYGTAHAVVYLLEALSCLKLPSLAPSLSRSTSLFISPSPSLRPRFDRKTLAGAGLLPRPNFLPDRSHFTCPGRMSSAHVRAGPTEECSSLRTGQPYSRILVIKKD
ncbi:unnamed protein product [Nezara viridula]|uniref:Uncharacterized protein n=1 Tax=Nezara viridula TaxID=85310 RepID=A0A9P0GZH7_NEZVI|nr:unnamed protein product [Nezara viridula]